jgi:hypothetical protein
MNWSQLASIELRVFDENNSTQEQCLSGTYSRVSDMWSRR